jgi:2-succinyl-5-enolpyruvyl-6-hydroxy-3-cyclohexene-1-carboxylate synthase
LDAVTDRNSTFVSALVGALASAGVQHACISPGSRNTPLSLAFSAHPDITDWSHHDERSGSFFAIGLAVATGSPVAVVTTSGTATAELHPAIVEAHASGVPLIALTADRPTELFDVAAPQTIDQRSLYGNSVRWHHDLDVPDPADMPARAVAALGARLVLEATSAPGGPVHLNVRFREPLVVEPAFGTTGTPAIGRPILEPDTDAVRNAADSIQGRDGIIVAGPSRDGRLPLALTELAEHLGWPVLSDPISGLRTGTHSVNAVVGSDLLAAAGLLDRLSPEAVIRVGAPPTSKGLRAWLTTTSIPQVVIAPAGWPDPDASASAVLRADGRAALRALGAALQPSTSGWLERWATADSTASATSLEAMGPTLTEPAAARSLAGAAPDGASIWTASSMPIRDVDSFFPVTGRPLRLLGNRGANGIDGLGSTALGTAATGVPTIAHLGDLSMLHDVGALATAVRLALPITFLVVNNDGGGIFHFLPQADHEHFERHFGTPHGLRFRDVAEGFGLDAVVAETVDDLATAVSDTGDQPRLIEVITDRMENSTLHRQIADAVREALADV